ncbi:GNAT family N-acetyltransferase [Sodalis sp. dw_96]|uniref:GNAT family N-acetyltransferase n=1 Tax=Sodalis sp. dw_96 TaxID=2719794 RepID=UPI0031F6CD5A
MSSTMVESERLIARAPEQSDLSSLFSIFGDVRTHRFNPVGPLPDEHAASLCLESWLGHWQRNFFGTWTIVLKDNPDKIIGFGGLSYRDLGENRPINLGYRFAYETWGKGLATEFCRLAIDFGFNTLKLKEVSAIVRENHAASRRVLEKAGMRPVARLKEQLPIPASIIYSIKNQLAKNDISLARS